MRGYVERLEEMQYSDPYANYYDVMDSYHDDIDNIRDNAKYEPEEDE